MPSNVANDTGYSSPIRAGSPPAQQNSSLSIGGSSSKDSAFYSGPVQTLLQRRSSAQQSASALNTDVLPIAISTVQKTETNKTLSTSADLLQSISMRHLATEQPQPAHFRAVSESASTIGKSKGELVASQVFCAPDKVSANVSEWTQRLLANFKPPEGDPVPEIISRSVSGSSFSKDGLDADTSAGDLPRRRSRSPRLALSKSKAPLSPAVMQTDARAAPVRLSALSPTAELQRSPMEDAAGTLEEADEAMPLATKTVKQKGYLASAKGTIGRALGYSGSSVASGKAHSSVSSAKEKRRNSLKSGTEPTLTLPETFISFSASASSSLAPTPVTATQSSHALKVPKGSSGVLEMGTIVKPEAKPPTLASDLTEQIKDGPLVDRFGFVYDIKAGMKLLREARKRQQNGDDSIMNLDSPPEINVDELKEALGPSPSPTPGVDTALASASMQLTLSDDSTASKSEQQPPPSNQSIRRLLGQLGEMNESVEKSQRDAWDAFIKRRKAKVSKSKAEEDVARRKRKIAPQAPLSIGQPLDEQESEQFSEHLVGVASMGQSKEDDKDFRQLVKAGIPIVYRPVVSPIRD